MAKQTIYTVGGTVQAGGGIYIKRKADDELLELCLQGEFAFILSSRQVGKSSLMVRTAKELEKESVRSVIIDLSAIGVKVSPDEWYLGILNEISATLNLSTNIFAWWSQYAQLGQAQRFTNFFRDVLLKEVKERVVLFFDEIDSTLSIPFSDDFYLALRAVYNARSTVPDFKRLSFVLVGVATPSDLISDNTRTPFNIGHRVELNDFTLDEAFPLTVGLGEQAQQALSWIFNFTSGHPYLTQLLCSYLANSKNPLNEQAVASMVEQLFTGEQGKKDNNLQFVRDMLTRRAPDTRQVLRTYKDVLSSKPVLDDERSIVKAHLKISGIVRRQDEQLVVRNRIYARNFDQQWIKENTPSPTSRPAVIISLLMSVVAIVVAIFYANAAFSANQNLNLSAAERAAVYTAEFWAAKSPQEHLASLAGLFRLEGEYADGARDLFLQLSPDERKSLFDPTDSRIVREDQIVVAKKIYQELANLPDDNVLLGAMGAAVESADSKLASEMHFWLTGREGLNNRDYSAAEAYLTAAIDLNLENPGLYFDRAQVYIAEGKEHYQAALSDLTQVIVLDTERSRDVRGLIMDYKQLSAYLNDRKSDFPQLAFATDVRIRRIIYDAKNGSALPEIIARKEGDPPTKDTEVNETYDFIGIVYNFFWVNYDRDSIDDKGMEIKAIVHYQKSYDNAFWDGEQLVFGDGDIDLPEGQRLYNSFIILDTTAREYMYGVIQYEAGLKFSGQSGALAVSFGDIFGSLVKQYNLNQESREATWIYGEGLFTQNVNGVGVSSLKAPGTAYDDPVLGKDPQPAHMKDYVNTTSDNGGVHINSGIPNHAFYITAMEIGGYAWEKAGRIWYITLRDELQPDSDFQDAANHTFLVAGELYGRGSAEQEAVRKGWAEVGIAVEPSK